MNQKKTGLTRVINAAIYSYKGLVAAYRNEAAFRQELLLSVVLIPLAFWLKVTEIERIVLISSVVFVLVVELLNSGIESVVDRVGYEHHELAGRAKDMASAAVLLSIALLAYIWGTIAVF